MPDLDLRSRRAGDALGVITHGSLLDGVEMKLDAGCSVEDVSTGTFAVVQGESLDFFCLITDARIEAANEGILLNPPPASTPEGALLRRVLHGQSTYATVSLKPLLALSNQTLDTGEEAPRPVKTVPAHFSTVYRAAAEDVARVFGAEARTDRQYFEVGRPLDMESAPRVRRPRPLRRALQRRLRAHRHRQDVHHPPAARGHDPPRPRLGARLRCPLGVRLGGHAGGRGRLAGLRARASNSSSADASSS